MMFFFKKNIRAIVLSAIFVTLYLAGQYSRYNLEWNMGIYIIQGCFMFILFMIINTWSFQVRLSDGRFEQAAGKWWNSHVKEYMEVIGCVIILSVVYMVAFLSVYPGIFGYDGPIQIYQVFSPYGELTSHHPVIHTFVLKYCFMLGKVLLGSYNSGLAIYTVLQCFIMISACIYTIAWLRRRGCCLAIRIFALVYFAFNPIIQLITCSTTKDAIFSALFLLTYITLTDLLEECSKKNAIKYLVFSVLMCSFRNQGYYLLFFVFLLLLLFLRKQRKSLLVVFVSALAGFFIMSPLMSMLHIPKGDPKEMLSLPMQQMAYVWKQYEQGEEDLDEDDKKKLEELIAPEYLTQFAAHIADPVKTGFDTEVLKSDLWGYIKLYFKIGKEHPQSYIDEFLVMTRFYWDIGDFGTQRLLMYSDSFPDINICEIERNSLIEDYEEYLIDIADYFDRMPTLRILFGPALPIWLLLFVLIKCISISGKKELCGLGLLIGQWGILLLGPVGLYRYMLPLMLCTPVLLFVGFEFSDVRKQYYKESLNVIINKEGA